MKYLYLLLPGLLFPVLSGPGKRPPVDWPATFSAVAETNAGSFKLLNRYQLDLPQGKSSYHQQGIQRWGGGWVVSGSGPDKGYLYFASPAGNIHTKYTVPDDLGLPTLGDTLKYNHPGGFQIANNILAIGIENTDLRRDSYSRIVLLDVTDPRAPRHLPHLDIVRPATPEKVMTAGATAITELEDGYLIITGNWDSRRLDFYRTSSKELYDENTSVSGCLGSWEAGVEGKSYQNINVYGNGLDELYLIGLYSVDRSRDIADLLVIDASDWNDIKVRKIAEKEFSGGATAPLFVHGAGSYYDPVEAQLQIYSVEAHSHSDTVWCNLWVR